MPSRSTGLNCGQPSSRRIGAIVQGPRRRMPWQAMSGNFSHRQSSHGFRQPADARRVRAGLRQRAGGPVLGALRVLVPAGVSRRRNARRRERPRWLPLRRLPAEFLGRQSRARGDPARRRAAHRVRPVSHRSASRRGAGDVRRAHLRGHHRAGRGLVRRAGLGHRLAAGFHRRLHGCRRRVRPADPLGRDAERTRRRNAGNRIGHERSDGRLPDAGIHRPARQRRPCRVRRARRWRCPSSGSSAGGRWRA